MKKIIASLFVVTMVFMMTGCSSTPKQEPPQVINYYFIHVTESKPVEFDYHHRKHQGGTHYDNADHRKQRGRTAPNRALREEQPNHQMPPKMMKEHNENKDMKKKDKKQMPPKMMKEPIEHPIS